MNTRLLLSMMSCCSLMQAIPQEAIDKGFVDLREVDPSIVVLLRYATDENFVGKPVAGYHQAVLLMTAQAAQALKKVQEAVKKDGYSLVVYDAYRPQQAVNHFMRWSEEVADQKKKKTYYPRVNKADVFDLGYVAKRSGHSRGSTVDLTLIKLGNKLHPVKEEQRTLKDGFTFTFLDDGTEDMGSHFDLFDTASHYENKLIDDKYKARRTYLKNKMEEAGFNNYAEEWWHFTLKNEPYPAKEDASYHNFPVE